MQKVNPVAHRGACAPLPGGVDGGEGAEGGFRGVVAHFSEEISVYPFFLVERATAKASGQAGHFRHLVGLPDELRGVVVVDRGGVDAGIHAAVPHIEGVGAVEVPVLVGQLNKHRVVVPYCVGHGNGVGTIDIANQCVYLIPYQRHRVYPLNADGVIDNRLHLFATNLPTCHK